MRFAVSTRQQRWIFSGGVVLVGLLLGSAQASVITPTASLPLIGIPYVSPGAGAGCFTIATACVNPGPFIQTSVVSDMFSGGSQQIVANVTYDATLTPPGLDNIIGSVALVGTVDETVVNRTSNSETGPAAAVVAVPLASVAFNNEGADFEIVEVKDFTNLAGTSLVAQQFFEGTGDIAPVLANYTRETTFTSYAYFLSSTEIPLDQLTIAVFPSLTRCRLRRSRPYRLCPSPRPG